MTGRWPFKKTEASASLSLSAKKKAPPPKKDRNRPYLFVVIAQAMYDQNMSMGLRDVHLPGGSHLNARRVSVPPMLRRGQARRDEIRRRRAILPPDLHEDPAFAMDSE
jgi:hypothetical protein